MTDLDQSVWFNPIGFYYKQSEMQDQVSFNTRTYGFTTGYSARLFNHFVLSGGLGYTHSNLNWYQNQGGANIQSVSLSPSFGYLGDLGYAGIMLSGGCSFYDVDRKIQFSSIQRTAHNDHKSFDLLAGFSGALKLKLPEELQSNLVLMPTVNLDYLNIFEGGYRESGAGPINLSVNSVYSAFLRPELTLKMLEEFKMEKVCSTITIYVGWLSNIPLTNGYYTSKFHNQVTCENDFTMQSYHSPTNQLVLGSDILIIHTDNYSIKIGYEANIGNHYNIQEGNLNIDWMF